MSSSPGDRPRRRLDKQIIAGCGTTYCKCTTRLPTLAAVLGSARTCSGEGAVTIHAAHGLPVTGAMAESRLRPSGFEGRSARATGTRPVALDARYRAAPGGSRLEAAGWDRHWTISEDGAGAAHGIGRRRRRHRNPSGASDADVYVANLATDTLDATARAPPRNQLNVALRRCSRLARGAAPESWPRLRQGRCDQP